jgi:hypothetical protein
MNRSQVNNISSGVVGGIGVRDSLNDHRGSQDHDAEGVGQ